MFQKMQVNRILSFYYMYTIYILQEKRTSRRLGLTEIWI